MAGGVIPLQQTEVSASTGRHADGALNLYTDQPSQNPSELERHDCQHTIAQESAVNTGEACFTTKPTGTRACLNIL